jgi:PKD repeat protein
MDVPVAADLSWTGGDPDVEDTVTYEVYFGTSISPPLVAENLTETTYDLGMLDYSTEYYWQITATDNHGTSNGSGVWSFATKASPGTDLIGLWHFDEGTGGIAADSSENSNTGTLVNEPFWTTGKIGSALQFDGVDDYIEVLDSNSLDDITDEITLIAWIKPRGTARGAVFSKYLYQYDIPINERVFGLTVESGNTIAFVLSSDGTGTGTTWLESAETVTDDAWTHLAATSDGITMKIYINGQQAINTIDAPAQIHTSSHNLQIGAWQYSLSGRDTHFDGVIDEVKIYNWALSAGELREDYEAGSSNHLPTAFIDSITPDPAEQGKDTVSFTGRGTDTDGSVVAYNWSSSIDGQLSTASSFSKPASELSVGTHTIYFKVQDDEGTWSTEVTEDLTIIEPANQPPVSDPNGPYTGTEGVAIAYDGSDSYDTDGSIVAYEWAFGDGSTSSEVNPTHTYAQDGIYSVSLTVTDNDVATDTSATTATIADTEPVADFSAMPTSGLSPLTVALTDASTSHDGIVTWNWDFDNDSVTDSTEQNPTYVYAEEGVYTIYLARSRGCRYNNTRF